MTMNEALFLVVGIFLGCVIGAAVTNLILTYNDPGEP